MNFYDSVTKTLKDLNKLTRSLRHSVDSKAIVPYKVYSALLSQTGTSAPVAIVLENTLEITPSINYDGVGNYSVTSEGAFIPTKTQVLVGQSNSDYQVWAYGAPSGDYVGIEVKTGGSYANDGLFKTLLEVRVYTNIQPNQTLPSTEGKEGKVLGVSAGNLSWVNQQGSSVVYKKYVALLTQSGTSAPTATVLENTIGDIVWTRSSGGDYAGILADAFPTGKTIVPPFPFSTSNNVVLMPISTDGAAPLGYYNITRANNESNIKLQCFDDTIAFAELSDFLNGGHILVEIRVYP